MILVLKIILDTIHRQQKQQHQHFVARKKRMNYILMNDSQILLYVAIVIIILLHLVQLSLSITPIIITKTKTITITITITITKTTTTTTTAAAVVAAKKKMNSKKILYQNNIAFVYGRYNNNFNKYHRLKNTPLSSSRIAKRIIKNSIVSCYCSLPLSLSLPKNTIYSASCSLSSSSSSSSSSKSNCIISSFNSISVSSSYQERQFQLTQYQYQNSYTTNTYSTIINNNMNSNSNNNQPSRINNNNNYYYNYNTRRSYYGYKKSYIQMMPEGPEVRSLVNQLQPAIGYRLINIQFISGRYVKNGPPQSFTSFASSMSKYNFLNNININIDNNNNNNNNSNVDIIVDWNCKGKFIYMLLDNGGDGVHTSTKADGITTSNNNNKIDPDYQRSLWITLGMTGKFISEQVYQDLLQVQKEQQYRLEQQQLEQQQIQQQLQQPTCSNTANDVITPVPSSKRKKILSKNNNDNNNNKYDTSSFNKNIKDLNHVRWILHLVNISNNNSIKMYYIDQREFGTIKFSLSKHELLYKLSNQLGIDILSSTTSINDCLAVLQKSIQRCLTSNSKLNICKFCMDQTKLCGVGNYILAEALYRSLIDPFCTIDELSNNQQYILCKELLDVAHESYTSLQYNEQQQLNSNDNDNDTADAPRLFEFQCYGQQYCKQYNEPVIRETNGPHGRTIWYTERQLFISRSEREQRLDLKQQQQEQEQVQQQQLQSEQDGKRKLIKVSDSDNQVIAAIPTTTRKARRIQKNTTIESMTTAEDQFELDVITSSAKSGTLSQDKQIEQQQQQSNVQSKPFKNMITSDNIASFLSTVSNNNKNNIVENEISLDDKDVNDTIDASDDFDDDDDDTVKVRVDALIELMQQSITDPYWSEALQKEFQSEYFRQLATVLVQEGYGDDSSSNNNNNNSNNQKSIIYPPIHNLFTALNECPLSNVKVIILGQDPYHGPGQAHGLAFSIPRQQQQQQRNRNQRSLPPPIIKVPPSLRNILKEVIDDVGIEIPTHGNLLRWSNQGVLLLNTVLTVRDSQPNSHANIGWEQFTDAIIRCVQEQQQQQQVEEKEEQNNGIVYLLWGNAAVGKIDSITSMGGGSNNTNNNVSSSNPIIIRTSHPSPLGAMKTKFPFIGSKCFSRANKALISIGKDPIDWNLYDDDNENENENEEYYLD